MKLVRYGDEGHERPGLVDAENRIRDLGALVADIDGTSLMPAVLAKIAVAHHDLLPVVDGMPRLGSCVARPTNFIAIGLNYRSHAEEVGMAFPEEPAIFQKASNCVCGPRDPIVQPRGSQKLDWEIEIGVVIGTRASYVDVAAAMDHIAGFCLANDVSERSFQLERGPTWTKGKSAESFGPLGPWLVTRDEVADPGAIEMWLDVGGERMQSGSTTDMIFGFAEIVASVSTYMVLEPGDVIVTGTPAGVGHGRKPPRYLRPGEIVTLGATGLGEQRHELLPAAV